MEIIKIRPREPSQAVQVTEDNLQEVADWINSTLPAGAQVNAWADWGKDHGFAKGVRWREYNYGYLARPGMWVYIEQSEVYHVANWQDIERDFEAVEG